MSVNEAIKSKPITTHQPNQTKSKQNQSSININQNQSNSKDRINPNQYRKTEINLIFLLVV